MQISIHVILGLLLVLANSQAKGQSPDFILGPVAVSKGGAVAADIEDATALYYNPAGLGFGKSSSTSYNAYYQSENRIEQFLQENDFQTNSTGTPYFAGVKKRFTFLQKMSFGAAIYDGNLSFSRDKIELRGKVPLTVDDDPSYEADMSMRQYQKQEDSTLTAIVGAGMRFDRHGLGLSLAFTKYSQIATETQSNYIGPIPLGTTDGEAFVRQSLHTERTSQALYPTWRFGYQYRGGDWAAGISASWTSHIRVHQTEVTEDLSVLVDKNNEAVEFGVGDQTAKIPILPQQRHQSSQLNYHPPIKVRLGLAKRFKELALNGDVIGRGPGSNEEGQRLKSSVGFASGAKIFPDRKFPLTFGASYLPDQRQSQTLGNFFKRQGEFIDFYYLTSGIGYHKENWQLFANLIHMRGIGKIDTSDIHPGDSTHLSKMDIFLRGASLGIMSDF